MNDYIKKESISGTLKIIVGDKNNDLVLKTLGRVYIQTGSKLTLLSDLLKLINVTKQEDLKNTLINVDSTKDLDSLPYPGDGILIFIKSNKNLYVCIDNTYIPIVAKNEADVNWDTISSKYVKKEGDTMTGKLIVPTLYSNNQISINEISKPPFNVISSKVVNNLNSNYLDGYQHSDFPKIKEDSRILGLWSFNKKTTFESDVLYDGSLVSKSGFASGFMGYGWKLDSSSNTLTIDNLIVRKIMNVYELVVNKISATNGSLWVTDSAKIEECEKLIQVVNNSGSMVYKINEINEYVSIEEAITSFNYILESENLDKEAYIYIANTEELSNSVRKLYEYYFTGNIYKIKLDGNNAKYCPFRVNDILRCLKFYGNYISAYDAIVINVLENEIIIRLNSINYADLEELGNPENGDGLVRIGNISDENRQGSIYLTSSDGKSPFIDVCRNLNRPDFSIPIFYYKGTTLTQYKPNIVRLGRIDGITDPIFGSEQPEGMGLVAENVFLKGKFVQVQAGKEYMMPLFKGNYDPTQKYYYYDYIIYKNVSYICVYNEMENGAFKPVLGIAPDSEENENELYWKVYISGVNGQNATVIDLSNLQTMVNCDLNGNILNTIQSTEINVYNGSKIDTSWEFSIYDKDLSDCYLVNNVLNVRSINKDTTSIIITATKKDCDPLFKTYTIIKVYPGKDGSPALSYYLVPSTNVILKKANDSFIPDFIGCKAYKLIGGNIPELVTDCIIKYSINGSDYLIYTDSISTNIYNNITFRLYDDNNKLWDEETIPVISDGADGYSIQRDRGYWNNTSTYYYDKATEAMSYEEYSKYYNYDSLYILDYVTYKGNVYFAIGNNTGLTPSTSSSFWKLASKQEYLTVNNLLANNAKLGEFNFSNTTFTSSNGKLSMDSSTGLFKCDNAIVSGDITTNKLIANNSSGIKISSMNENGDGSYILFYTSGNKRMEFNNGNITYYNDDADNSVKWILGESGEIVKTNLYYWSDTISRYNGFLNTSIDLPIVGYFQLRSTAFDTAFTTMDYKNVVSRYKSSYRTLTALTGTYAEYNRICSTSAGPNTIPSSNMALLPDGIYMYLSGLENIIVTPDVPTEPDGPTWWARSFIKVVNSKVECKFQILWKGTPLSYQTTPEDRRVFVL